MTGGRVSPTMAKLSVSSLPPLVPLTEPPAPPLPPEPLEPEPLEPALVDPSHGAGGDWHLHVSTLHHQPP